MKKLLSLLSIVCLTSSLSANYIDINQGTDSTETSVSVDMYVKNMRTVKKVDLSFDYIDHDVNGKLYSFLIKADNYSQKNKYLKLTLGAKIVMNDSSKEGSNYLSIPIGLEVDGIINSNRNFPIGLRLSAYYADSILTLKDSEKYLEYRAEVYGMISKNFQLYTGVKNIETDLKSTSVEYDSGVYAGAKFIF